MNHGKWALVLATTLLSLHGNLQAHEAAAGKTTRAKETQLPARKSGLWEVTVRSDELMLRRQGQAQSRPQTVQMCTSVEAESVMLFAIVPGQQNCREVNARPRSAKSGGGWDIRTLCFVHDNRVETEMQLTGDLQAEYRGAYNVKYPATPMHNTGRMLFEGRRLGDCRAGQQPGDMVLPNGVTVNVVADQKRAEEAGHKH